MRFGNGLGALLGQRIGLGQEETRRLPFWPEPAVPGGPPEIAALLARRDRAHDEVVRVRAFARGIAKEAATIERFLGEKDTVRLIDEAALAIERAEEAYLAAESALSRARIAEEAAAVFVR